MKGTGAGWVRPFWHWRWHYFPLGWACSACFEWLSFKPRLHDQPPDGARVCRKCLERWSTRCWS